MLDWLSWNSWMALAAMFVVVVPNISSEGIVKLKQTFKIFQARATDARTANQQVSSRPGGGETVNKFPKLTIPGEVHFFRDIYGEDQALEKDLAAQQK
jgi:hypothetical protein